MERREAIQRVAAALGGVLTGPTLAGLLAGCEARADGSPYGPRSLTPAEFRRVEEIAELIIPTTDTPGARAAGVAEFVDGMLTDFYPADRREQFLGELRLLEDAAMRLTGSEYDGASSSERVAILEALDQDAFPDREKDPAAYDAVTERIAAGDPPFMRTMKELTVAGYYTSEVGQTVELRPVPFGPYEADVPFRQIGRTWA